MLNAHAGMLPMVDNALICAKSLATVSSNTNVTQVLLATNVPCIA